MALSTMMKIKTSEISDAVNSIPAPLRDTLMKYVYKGFENPKDYSSSALLTWHEKVILLIEFFFIYFCIIQGSCRYRAWFDCTSSYRSSNGIDLF
jgi:hypothetical protein